jgi:carboxyl-terminal processing protease
MIKKLFVCFAISFLLTVTFADAQNNKIQYSTSELVGLGKAWGFLKYYHPVVSQGKLDWDSLLISSLNQPKQPISKVIDRWLELANQLDLPSASLVQNEPSDSIDFRNLNLNWINKAPYLSKSQKAQFLKWTKVEQPVGIFYSKGAKNTYSFSKEKNYADTIAANRILGLYRFWNVIEYYYPYKYAIGNHWDETLNKFIPIALQAVNEKAMAQFITRLAASINDTHATVEPVPNPLIFGKLGPPFKFKVVENTVVITKIVDSINCAKANLGIGDLITTIDKKSIAQIIAAQSGYLSSSNQSVKVRDAFYYLFNGDAPAVMISGVKKNGVSIKGSLLRIKRNYLAEWDREGNPDNLVIYYDDKLKKLIYSRILDGNIGYIDRASFVNTEIDSIMRALGHTKGIILDLRSYTRASASLVPFNFLLPKPTPYAKMSQPDFNRPGTFRYVDYVLASQGKKITTIGKINPDYYKGKVVLLVNESTQSAEELWAMMYQTIPGVVVVGSQTAGADGNETPIKVVGEYTIIMSGLGIFYPNGKETQRIGIVPNVVVKPTIKDMQDQKDVLLEKALEIIRSSGN